MTSDGSPRPISPLRARMIEDMTVRGFKEDTRRDYVRQVRAFAAFIGRSPDTATAEDLRLFQLHQTQSGMQPPSINSAVSALRFFFTVTLDRPDLARRLTVVPYPRRIPAVLSVEEVTLLLRATTASKYKAAFATAYGAGLRVSEVVASRSAISIPSACCCASSAAKAARTAMPCCRHSCSNCCASGGGRGGGGACCCREAGCFPAATRSSRCRLVISAAPSVPPPGRGDQKTRLATYAAALGSIDRTRRTQLNQPPFTNISVVTCQTIPAIAFGMNSSVRKETAKPCFQLHPKAPCTSPTKCFLRHSDLDGWNCRSRKMLGPTVRPCARRSNRNRCHYRDLQDQNSWSRIVQEHSNGTLIGAKPSTNPHKAPASIWRVPGAAATAPSRACEVEPSASGFSLVKITTEALRHCR